VTGGTGGRAHPTFTGSPTEHVEHPFQEKCKMPWACSACLQAKGSGACGVRQPREPREAGLVRAGHTLYLAWPQVRQLRRYPATAVLRI
jgi:hypothetical protein